MMTTAIFLPEARDDIDAAYTAFETRSAGLGDRFLDAVARVVRLIEGTPVLYGEVAPGIRAAVTRRFPFVIYYREDLGEVIILAVRHGRDDPAIWQGRV